MDIRERLNLLGAAARYDDCSASAPDAVAERARLLRAADPTRLRLIPAYCLVFPI